MRHVLALVTLGLILTFAASTSYAADGPGNGPVFEIHRDAGKPQGSVTGPGYTTVPQSPSLGYDTGFSTVVPTQPFWVVQFHF